MPPATSASRHACPTDLDCKHAAGLPAAGYAPQPDINYLAKDYASFRQLILDRLALIMPDWQETHVPDIGIMLVELLAYAGDLSQLLPGRGRDRSLSRHRPPAHLRAPPRAAGRLCDARRLQRARLGHDCDQYRNDDARPGERLFHARRSRALRTARVLQPDDLANAPPGSYEIFEPLVVDASQPIALGGAQRNLFLHLGRLRVLLAARARPARR